MAEVISKLEVARIGRVESRCIPNAITFDRDPSFRSSPVFAESTVRIIIRLFLVAAAAATAATAAAAAGR
jgi:hypothetical protein